MTDGVRSVALGILLVLVYAIRKFVEFRRAAGSVK